MVPEFKSTDINLIFDAIKKWICYLKHFSVLVTLLYDYQFYYIEIW